MHGKGAAGQREGNPVKGGIILAGRPGYASFLETEHDTAALRPRQEIHKAETTTAYVHCFTVCKGLSPTLSPLGLTKYPEKWAGQRRQSHL